MSRSSKLTFTYLYLSVVYSLWAVPQDLSLNQSSKLPDWTTKVIEANCSQSLALSAASPTFKNQSGQLESEDLLKLKYFLEISGLSPELIPEASRELEILIEKSAIFKTPLLGHLIIRTLVTQFQLKEDISSLAVYQKFSTFSEAEQQRVFRSLIDQLAILFKASTKAPPEEMAKLLNMSLDKYLEAKNFWNLYALDDPALYRLEVALRFFFQFYKESISDTITRLTTKWGFKKLKKYNFNLTFSIRPNVITYEEHLEGAEYSKANWAWRLRDLTTDNPIYQDSENSVYKFSDPFVQYLFIRYHDRFSLEFLEMLCVNTNTEVPSYIEKFADYIMTEIRTARARLSDALKSRALDESRVSDVMKRMQSLEARKLSLQSVLHRLKTDSNKGLLDYNQRVWVDQVTLSKLQSLADVLKDKDLELQRLVIESSSFNFMQNNSNVESNSILLNLVKEFLKKQMELHSEKKVRWFPHFKDLEKIFDFYASTSSSTELYEALIYLINQIDKDTGHFDKMMEWVLWLKSICRGLGLSNIHRGRIIDLIKNKFISAVSFDDHTEKRSLLHSIIGPDREWSNGKKPIEEPLSITITNETPLDKIRATISLLTTSRDRILRDKEQLTDEISKLRLKLYESEIQGLKSEIADIDSQLMQLQNEQLGILQKLEESKRLLDENKIQLLGILKEKLEFSRLRIQ